MVIKRHLGVPGEVVVSVCISAKTPDVSGWKHYVSPSALMLAVPTKPVIITNAVASE